ncbi:hypothetical protein G3I59_09555 [Amycolatopsis rubida]|uniref:Uncharacterized protein n=1 Tax=Amycolatopsis rubida TaxID=112413 RepID=A0ABX0BP20_9PSEU|nr:MULTISPECIES: hypothetical protein [Amycolatopsis]MYW90844.1 hypothetical protein [Amycolatopsis rubida]NEC55827.1 hypothetical protein [Amycolatopsis rubida]
MPPGVPRSGWRAFGGRAEKTSNASGRKYWHRLDGKRFAVKETFASLIRTMPGLPGRERDPVKDGQQAR